MSATEQDIGPSVRHPTCLHLFIRQYLHRFTMQMPVAHTTNGRNHSHPPARKWFGRDNYLGAILEKNEVKISAGRQAERRTARPNEHFLALRPKKLSVGLCGVFLGKQLEQF